MGEETLEERLAAVERALTDSDQSVADLEAAADVTDGVAEIETRIDAMDVRLTELEATTQALRGYVGNIRSVNRDVEQQAEAALASVDALQERLADETAGTGRAGAQPEDGASIPAGPTDALTETRPADQSGARDADRSHGQWGSPSESTAHGTAGDAARPDVTDRDGESMQDPARRADGDQDDSGFLDGLTNGL